MARHLTPARILAAILVLAVAWVPIGRAHRLVRALSGQQLGGQDQAARAAAVESAARSAFTIGELQKAVGFLRAVVLREWGSGRVVVGSGGFLFYRAENGGDGHVFDDLAGDIPYSPAVLDAIAGELRREDQAVRAAGGRLLTVIVPDKEAVYGDLLPLRYRASGRPTRLDQLLGRLQREQGIAVLDLRPVLVQARTTSPLPLYFRTDTHWNEWGKYLGYRAIAERLAPLFPQLHAVVIDPAQVASELLPGKFRNAGGGIEAGDLVRIHPQQYWFPEAARSEQLLTIRDLEQRLARGARFGPDRSRAAPPAVGDSCSAWPEAYQTSCTYAGAEIAGELIVLHDSFGVFPLSYLATHFRSSTFLRTHLVDLAEIARRRPVLVVHIIVGRYLDVLNPAHPRSPPAAHAAAAQVAAAPDLSGALAPAGVATPGP